MSLIQPEVSRKEWGARPFPRGRSPINHTHLEVHHSVYPQRKDWSGIDHCKAIERQHLSQGWNGPFYNLGMDWNGILYELRGIGWVSHSSALTVVLFGDFDGPDHLRLVQKDRLAQLANQFSRPVDWHQKRAAGTKYASACPGRNVIPFLRNELATHVPTDWSDDEVQFPAITVARSRNPENPNDERLHWWLIFNHRAEYKHIKTTEGLKVWADRARRADHPHVGAKLDNKGNVINDVHENWQPEWFAEMTRIA